MKALERMGILFTNDTAKPDVQVEMEMLAKVADAASCGIDFDNGEDDE